MVQHVIFTILTMREQDREHQRRQQDSERYQWVAPPSAVLDAAEPDAEAEEDKAASDF